MMSTTNIHSLSIANSLVSGYIHNHENAKKLIIPSGIIQIIFHFFYISLPEFAWCKEVKKYGKSIKIINDKTVRSIKLHSDGIVIANHIISSKIYKSFKWTMKIDENIADKRNLSVKSQIFFGFVNMSSAEMPKTLSFNVDTHLAMLNECACMSLYGQSLSIMTNRNYGLCAVKAKNNAFKAGDLFKIFIDFQTKQALFYYNDQLIEYMDNGKRVTDDQNIGDFILPLVSLYNQSQISIVSWNAE